MNIKYTITKAIDKRISKSAQENIKYYLHIGLTLLIIASVTATMLSFVNALTREKIAENELAVMQDAIGRIFEDSDGIRTVEKEYESPVVAVYEVYKGDEFLGRGIQVDPAGFKEAIGMIVGVDSEGKCVGVEIISLSDTPGVGTKVKEKSFLERFNGTTAENIDGVELISGATISSTAVKNGVDAALKLKFGEDADEEASDTPDAPDVSDEELEDYIEANPDENINEEVSETLEEVIGEVPFETTAESEGGTV